MVGMTRREGYNMETLSLKRDVKFALLGAGHHLCTMVRALLERGFPPPVIVTHPKVEHERDRLLMDDPNVYQYVFDVAEELGVTIIEAASVNDGAVVSVLKKQECSAAFSFSCRSIIRQSFIDVFDGHVFNVHPSLLPQERGGGTFSWRIMNNIHEASATLHLIDSGIDTGDILYQTEGQVEVQRPTPNDYLRKTNELYADLIYMFLDDVEAERPIERRLQDVSKATYLPRLYTEMNGAIDWAWSRKEIDRFIRAFGPPYPGAFTFVGTKKIFILDAEPAMDSETFHPFMSGRIDARLEDGILRVITADGYLYVRSVAIDGVQYNPAEAVGLTEMFSTPHEVLENAKNSVVWVKRMKPGPGARA
jgi:methionyl-tRNA formyltransferase